MKLSLISLIAATLAGIAGSAVATPVPLHARTLQQVDSYERDINIYSRETEVLVRRGVNGAVDNLFLRQPPSHPTQAGGRQPDQHAPAKRVRFALTTEPVHSLDKGQSKARIERHGTPGNGSSHLSLDTAGSHGDTEPEHYLYRGQTKARLILGLDTPVSRQDHVRQDAFVTKPVHEGRSKARQTHTAGSRQDHARGLDNAGRRQDTASCKRPVGKWARSIFCVPLGRHY